MNWWPYQAPVRTHVEVLIARAEVLEAGAIRMDECRVEHSIHTRDILSGKAATDAFEMTKLAAELRAEASHLYRVENPGDC